MIPALEKDWKKDLAMCAVSPHYFLKHHYKTYDPNDKENPVKLFPAEWKYIYDLITSWVEMRDNPVVFDKYIGQVIFKTRQLLVSTTGMGWYLWNLLYGREGFSARITTETAEKCYNGTKESLMGKIEFGWENLPEHLKQKNITFKTNPIIFENHNTGTILLGAATTGNVGRGGTTEEAWADEFAYLGNKIGQLYKSLLPLTNNLKICSTANGKNFFEWLVKESKKGNTALQYVELPKESHPLRTAEYYDKKRRSMTPSQFATEYGLSFETASNALVFALEPKIIDLTPELINNYLTKRGYRLVAGMDIGLADDTAVVTCIFNPKTEDLIIIDVFSLNNMLPEAITGFYKKRLSALTLIDEAVVLNGIIVHIDPSAYNRSIATGRSAAQVYNQCGLATVKNNKQLIKDGIADCQRWFGSDKLQFTKNVLVLLDEIYSCHYPIDMNSVVKSFDRYADTNDGQCNFNVHVIDALRYLLSNVRKSVTEDRQIEEFDTGDVAPMSLRLRANRR